MVAPSERRALKNPVQFAPPGNERQVAVVEAFQHAWTGYKKYAWGHDHLKPISQSHNDWFGLGLSIIDGIDTMYIMGLKDEFAEAQDWIMNHLTFNEFHDVNLFEVTIRVLGGLLSIFHLSGDKIFLDKAVDLGERLMPCFTKSPSPIPFSDVNLASHTAHSPRWGPDSSTSEVTTLQLEFRDLSYSSKDPKFEEAAFKVSKYVNTLPKVDGLVPIFINPNTGQFHSNTDIKIGARGDSYYEYLLKQWIQTGKKIDFLKEDYLKAIKGIQNRLLRRSSKNNLLFIGELKGPSKEFVPKMDHLVCYLPGTLALGVLHGLPFEHHTLAEELLETCYRMYSERPTFLAPEITFFSIKGIGNPDQDMYVKSNDAHNLLRPEFLESLWYMYQINGNTTYQDWGWTIFQALQKYTRVKDGYTSIGNVNNPDSVRPRDMMESFFLSETLKYLYLLFANDRKLLDLTKWVVNSEAHPLPILSL
uniref:alpha-1,2-Mannosidase n=2 Tax=Clastoptera arizonana TaxID=38151 RepID=A0A1B6E7L9_9HEMI